ncbi:hypothetical protein JW960_02385 [candidate division KSB1 bacterium]|nr:hypothetical protein [candidate division KSB1 bacterium]
MNVVRLIPVIFSFLLLAAHYSRAQWDWAAVLCLVIPFVLFVKKRWVPRLMQVLLVLGALEWIGTTHRLVLIRQAEGMPWTRLAIILISVALFTGLSTLVFRNKALRARYGITKIS